MFLEESDDYRTVWKLAHQWANAPLENSDPANLPSEIKHNIHRVLAAIGNKSISARNKKGLIFADNGAFDFYVFELFNYLKLIRMQRTSKFDQPFLDSIYVKRPEVLRWCQNDFITPPQFWAPAIPAAATPEETQTDEDEETGWYEDLTDKRKKRVACLEVAKKLWSINPEQSYEDVFRHPIMQQYGNPQIFSLRSFKEWANPFASEFAKTGGRPKDSNPYDQLKKR